MGEVLGTFGWVAGWKQVMLPHCVTGWPDEGVWGLVRPPTAAATALSRTDGRLHVKAVTPTTTTRMHKHTTYDRSIVVTLCYTQLLAPLFMLRDYVMIWLYILVLTDLRPAPRDTQQTLRAGQCHFACGSMPDGLKGVILLAGYSQSAGWGEGSDSPRTEATLASLTCLLWNMQKALFWVNHGHNIHQKDNCFWTWNVQVIDYSHNNHFVA